MSKKRLLVYGDVEMDVLLKTDALDDPGQDVKVNHLTFSPGGSAANCAAIAGNLGQGVTLLGSMGGDVWRKPLLQDLKRFRVNTRYINISEGSSGTCVALVDESGERKFYSYRGVNESDPPALPPAMIWKNHHCLHLSGYSFQEPNSGKTARTLLYKAKEHGIAVSLDPSYLFAKQPAADLNDLLQQLDFFFPNREEAALLGGSDNPLQAARKLHSIGIKTVVVTLGNEGCLILGDSSDGIIRFDPQGSVVDTTGAGDAFCGGFLVGWLNGLDILQSGKLGCAAAAHIVTQIGAREHAPTLKDVLSIMRRNHEDNLADIMTQRFHHQESRCGLTESKDE